MRDLALKVTPVDYGAKYLSNATYAMYKITNLVLMGEGLVLGFTKAALSSVTSRPMRRSTQCVLECSPSTSIASGARTFSARACGPTSAESTMSSEA